MQSKQKNVASVEKSAQNLLNLHLAEFVLQIKSVNHVDAPRRMAELQT